MEGDKGRCLCLCLCVSVSVCVCVLTLLAALQDEVHHYKVGFQLLWVDTKVASKFFWRVLHGETLTR